MGRFYAQDADNYGSNGNGGGFFSLKNDKDVARVRFLYNTIDDVEGVACHQVEINDKKRYVNCLREYNQPITDCPFCASGKAQIAKLFVPLYDITEDKVKTWERGKKFFAKLSSLCSRYPNLVSHVFEIERNGKAGEQTTTYEIFEVEKDNSTLEDFPEAPQVIGGLVLDKSADEMNYFLDYGEFPEDSNGGGNSGGGREMPIRRGGDSGRRTPASSGNRRGDRF